MGVTAPSGGRLDTSEREGHGLSVTVSTSLPTFNNGDAGGMEAIMKHRLMSYTCGIMWMSADVLLSNGTRKLGKYVRYNVKLLR